MTKPLKVLDCFSGIGGFLYNKYEFFILYPLFLNKDCLV